ncbi:hypothetical protein [Nostoc sp.]|uniref:hypothetical protein n=1 Tax=Nostoc sp. TaxID=1180 RepID=UPI002FFA9ADD
MSSITNHRRDRRFGIKITKLFSGWQQVFGEARTRMSAFPNTVRLKAKGEREKVLNISFTPYRLTFSQNTRKVKSAYLNHIDLEITSKTNKTVRNC